MRTCPVPSLFRCQMRFPCIAPEHVIDTSVWAPSALTCLRVAGSRVDIRRQSERFRLRAGIWSK
jgi:hypothetical protein